jgi:hypothetical protein
VRARAGVQKKQGIGSWPESINKAFVLFFELYSASFSGRRGHTGQRGMEAAAPQKE